jgi:hypothetical protein
MAGKVREKKGGVGERGKRKEMINNKGREKNEGKGGSKKRAKK